MQCRDYRLRCDWPDGGRLAVEEGWDTACKIVLIANAALDANLEAITSG